MPGSAFQLPPFAGQSISLRFPLLLLLLPPSPVLPADPGAPAPGRRPLSCPRRAPVLRPWLGTPRPPLPSRLPSFPFRLAVPGRGEGAVSRWDGGSLQTPGGVAWARSPRGSFCRERADWDLGRLWEKGPRLSRPPHLFWDPSGPSRLSPQQSSLFPLRAPFGGSRRRQGKAGWRVLFLQPLTFQAPSGFSAPVETICPGEDRGSTRHCGERRGKHTYRAELLPLETESSPGRSPLPR